LSNIELCNNGRCERVRMGEERHVDNPPLKPITDIEIDELIIEHTRDRITHELNNVSADELKANVLAGISVIFAILVVSQNWTFFTTPVWYIVLPIIITVGFLITTFVFAIKVLSPRTKRFTLWDPRKSNDHYSSMKLDDVKKELKEELVTFFEEIVKSRKKDEMYIKSGYYFLLTGSIGIFITLLVVQFLNLV